MIAPASWAVIDVVWRVLGARSSILVSGQAVLGWGARHSELRGARHVFAVRMTFRLRPNWPSTRHVDSLSLA